MVRLYCVLFVVLFIFLTMFIVAPIAFAQEDSDIGERIARIEGILEQMNERLNDLSHLGGKLDTLQNSVNLMWVTLTVAIVVSPIIGAIIQKRLK